MESEGASDEEIMAFIDRPGDPEFDPTPTWPPMISLAGIVWVMDRAKLARKVGLIGAIWLPGW